MPRCMLHESCTILIFLAYRVSAEAYGFAVLVRLGHKCPLLCKRDLTSTATHPTRGCAFSGRIRRVDTAARRLSAKVADIRVQARATGLRYVNIGCYDGSAKTLPASCTNLAVFLRWHMFGQCVRLCGCAGCAWPSHSTS